MTGRVTAWLQQALAARDHTCTCPHCHDGWQLAFQVLESHVSAADTLAARRIAELEQENTRLEKQLDALRRARRKGAA